MFFGFMGFDYGKVESLLFFLFGFVFWLVFMDFLFGYYIVLCDFRKWVFCIIISLFICLKIVMGWMGVFVVIFFMLFVCWVNLK